MSSSPYRSYRPLQHGRTVTAYGRSEDVHDASDVPHAARREGPTRLHSHYSSPSSIANNSNSSI